VNAILLISLRSFTATPENAIIYPKKSAGKECCPIKSFGKKLANGLFLLLVFGLTLWSVFRGEDLKEVLFYLNAAEPGYIVMGIGCVLLYILADAVSIHYLLRSFRMRVPLTQCCLYSFLGFFYCCVTPSASGGQPMQIYHMHKNGIPVALSSVILAVISIVYKLVLVLAGTLILLFRPPALMVHLEPVLPLVYLGLGLNLAGMLALLLLVFYPAIVRFPAEKLFALLNRIRPMKRLPQRRAQLDRLLDQYQGAAAYYRSHKKIIVHLFLIALLQRFTLYLVTWFTYRAFSLSGSSLPLITGLQAMVSLSADMLPLPGGMGVSENVFLDIFPAIFGEELVLPGMVISRGISYYTQLLICSVMSAFAHFYLKKKRPKP